MERLDKTRLFSFWERVAIVFGILGFMLVVLTMPPFNMPRWYHLLVGVVGTMTAIVGLIKWRHLLGPTGALIGLVVATICYGVYAGYIVQ